MAKIRQRLNLRRGQLQTSQINSYENDCSFLPPLMKLGETVTNFHTIISMLDLVRLLGVIVCDFDFYIILCAMYLLINYYCYHEIHINKLY